MEKMNGVFTVALNAEPANENLLKKIWKSGF